MKLYNRNWTCHAWLVETLNLSWPEFAIVAENDVSEHNLLSCVGCNGIQVDSVRIFENCSLHNCVTAILRDAYSDVLNFPIRGFRWMNLVERRSLGATRNLSGITVVIEWVNQVLYIKDRMVIRDINSWITSHFQQATLSHRAQWIFAQNTIKLRETGAFWKHVWRRY